MSGSSLVSLAVGAALVAVGALPSPVRAYVRQTVDRDPTVALFWEERQVVFSIAEDTSLDASPQDVRSAVSRSLGAWSNAGGCTDLVLLPGPRPTDLDSNLTSGRRDDENTVIVRETGWPMELGSAALAVTSIVYRRNDGTILDADIDVNAVDHLWSAALEPPLDRDDLENTVTHELGHAIGFAHVPDPLATMFGESEPGDILKRDLAADDLAAVCEVYPVGAPTPPLLGASTAGCGCAVHRRASFEGLLAPVLALGVLLALNGARRR